MVSLHQYPAILEQVVARKFDRFLWPDITLHPIPVFPILQFKDLQMDGSNFASADIDAIFRMLLFRATHGDRHQTYREPAHCVC